MIEKQLFYKADDIINLLSVGRTVAYKIIRDLNKELTEKGYCTFAGRVSAKYFQERYGIYQQ